MICFSLFPSPSHIQHHFCTVLSGGKTITNELISTCHWKACWNAASELEVKEEKSLNLLNTTVLYWFLLSYLSSWSRYPALSKGEPPLPEEQLPASEAWLFLPSNPSSPLPPALLACSVSWCNSFLQVCRKLFFSPQLAYFCVGSPRRGQPLAEKRRWEADPSTAATSCLISTGKPEPQQQKRSVHKSFSLILT